MTVFSKKSFQDIDLSSPNTYTNSLQVLNHRKVTI